MRINMNVNLPPITKGELEKVVAITLQKFHRMKIHPTLLHTITDEVDKAVKEFVMERYKKAVTVTLVPEEEV